MHQVVAKHPRLHGIRPFMGMFLSAQGKHDEALAELTNDVKRNGEVDSDIAYLIGSVYALEGNRDEAFVWLERAISLGNENLPCFQGDPNWDALRDDDRFKKIVEPLVEKAKSRHRATAAGDQ
jgi:tetratricopeptide (TPR) repeat protein